mmetsp:Transcript_297/g.628  ORF Transcript_297/g.628 Transcript_297/m.628 type:complete len:212 (+) Transcript_297:569-1204(+)
MFGIIEIAFEFAPEIKQFAIGRHTTNFSFGTPCQCAINSISPKSALALPKPARRSYIRVISIDFVALLINANYLNRSKIFSCNRNDLSNGASLINQTEFYTGFNVVDHLIEAFCQRKGKVGILCLGESTYIAPGVCHEHISLVTLNELTVSEHDKHLCSRWPAGHCRKGTVFVTSKTIVIFERCLQEKVVKNTTRVLSQGLSNSSNRCTQT